jgi:hypothetical protein
MTDCAKERVLMRGGEASSHLNFPLQPKKTSTNIKVAGWRGVRGEVYNNNRI